MLNISTMSDDYFHFFTTSTATPCEPNRTTLTGMYAEVQDK